MDSAQSWLPRWMDRSERLFDGLGTRPIGLAVFVASVLALLLLNDISTRRGAAPAVAEAPRSEHPAKTESYVAELHVRPGDDVDVGTPLATLAREFLDRELALIETEIDVIPREMAWQLMRQTVQFPGGSDTTALEQAAMSYFEGERSRLEQQRDAFLEDLGQLTIKARVAGRVSSVLPLGSPVGIGTSVATITPVEPTAVVAYLPSDARPTSIQIGTEAMVSNSSFTCAESARVLRVGAAFEAAPKQIGWPLHGLPVRLSVPRDCALMVGEALSVRFTQGPP